MLDKPETKLWRLTISAVRDGEVQEFTEWKNKSDRTVRFKYLPPEVLLRAEFDFCSSGTSNDCDGVSAKIASRNINFLKHQFPEHSPRYPAVVFDVPRCYDSPEERSKTKTCQDLSEDVYLRLDFLKKSDSALWMDINSMLDKPETKFWRLIISAIRDDEVQEFTEWKNKSDRTARFRHLPPEVLLRAEFDFCSNETSNECDSVSAKVKTKNIDFLKHRLPSELSHKKTT
jgi:hypothetical protein